MAEHLPPGHANGECENHIEGYDEQVDLVEARTFEVRNKSR